MLSALELSGFKSFADRTRLEFPTGVTAVVGPNGSGKSNVVDGIKWVLGSQSAKQLRGSEMTDVIFNGSTSRRPQNTAEVSLEFDNSGGLFPVGGPIAEGESTVRLTRRVYRSGEGEYLINGAVVRLRDLRDLLAGTGMGSQGGGSYGIIEQGRVDAVLQSSPNDRRALFEEAAGISRFRLKKQEAARRLARVEQNLLRLSDIVDEVEGRLRRVRAQAGKAQRYREQADRLKQLRTELGLADWRALTASLQASESEGQQAALERDQAQADLEECEAALEAHLEQTDAGSAELTAAEARLSNVREAIALREARLTDATTQLVKAEQDIAAGRRKLLATQTRHEPSPTEDQTPSLVAAKERLAEAQQAAAEAEQTAAETTNERDGAQQEKQSLTDSLRVAHREVVKAEEKSAALRASQADSEEATQRARDAAEQAVVQLSDAVARRDAAAVKVSEHAAAVEEASAQLTAARDALQQIREELTTKQKELARAEAELVGIDHRHAAIEQLEQKLEKLASDIQGVLTDDSAGDAPTVHGMVADLLQVDYDTAPMIEAALGARAQHLVVDTADRLVAALADGEAALRVRASFQRLDAAAPATALDRLDLSAEPGVMGRADQFVDTDPLYEPLVHRLLAKTWFVDSLATAARLANGVGRGLSFVTYNGDVLSADGGIFVGPKNDDAGLITNRRQASQLHDDRHATETRVATLGAEVERLEKAIADATEREQSLFAQHGQATESLAAGRQELAGLEERVAHLQREEQQRAAQLAQADSKWQGLEQEATASNEQLATAADRERDVEEKLATATQRHADAVAALSTATSKANDARLALAKAEHDANALTAAAKKQQRDDSEHQGLREELTRQWRQAVEQADSSRQTLLVARSELAEFYLERDALVEDRKAVTKQRQHDQQLRRRGAQQVQSLRDRVAKAAQRAQQCELASNEHRHRRRTLEERMRDDYGIDLATVAVDAPEATAIDKQTRNDLESELEQLRNQVQSIGPVNSEALEELDDLESRFEQLSGQYQDLSAAKTSLERLTSRINADSRELFLATIETVREHFRELFRRLFGGGEADLVLLQDDDGDVLECGVEIVAQPPGKELSSISLLSGGEKTMTCVALLLALFRTKPSPFCVLDEVDAALDEANIGRFTAVITEFLAATQFLVVTHSKKTMMGADTIYGVTMQEPGVSTRVGVRFDDVGEDGQLRVSRPEGEPPQELRRAA